ncbi:basic salivary proline-rich protein 4-like [Malurus melanocephalus]|uniref:basic salivary proline-rich protein 4-like n=1 Tax=Malurus melanocephalus TaxID=175006 RepID=UPI00254833F2|nr:basic salivary proline-rich protein 4-like [Malurus melanocephalus]
MRGPAGGAGGASAPRGSARGRAGPEGTAPHPSASLSTPQHPSAPLSTPQHPCPGSAVPPAAGMRRPRRGAGRAQTQTHPSRRWQARPRAGSGQGLLGLRQHPTIPATESEENAPSRWHGGLRCPPHLRQLAERSAAPQQHPAASSRRCATGLRERSHPPPPPCAADPPPPPPIWGFSFRKRLPGRSVGTPLAARAAGAQRQCLPVRSVLGAAGPAPVPAPPQGSGRPNLARSFRASPGPPPLGDRHPPGKSDPCSPTGV